VLFIHLCVRHLPADRRTAGCPDPAAADRRGSQRLTAGQQAGSHRWASRALDAGWANQFAPH